MSKKSLKEQQIKELENLAAEVIKMKEASHRQTPLVVEFSGSPKSGKTTTIRSIELFFRRNGYKTSVITEKASICPISNKHSYNFNIWTFSQMISEFVYLTQDNSMKDRDGLQNDIIFIDRGIFDAICWFQWHKDKSMLDISDSEILFNYITRADFLKKIDLIISFIVPPETSIEREHASLLTTKRGSIMREDILLQYNEAILHSINNHNSLFSQIEKYDSTGLKPVDVNYDITKLILSKLRQKLIERIGYFSNDLLSLKSGSSVYNLDSHSLKFEERNDVEKTKNLQPIAVAVITNKEKNKVYVVKKNKKSLDKNSPELDKYLIWIGGHTRLEDSLKSETNLTTLQEALRRELLEELGLPIYKAKLEVPTVIYVPDSEKSKKHFAVCFHISIDEDTTLDISDYELVEQYNSSKYGKFQDINSISFTDKKYDSWSRVIAKDILGAKKVDLQILEGIQTDLADFIEGE